MQYIENRLVKKDSIESRAYQINLAKQAISENCVVVLPTGLGKTTVALHVICKYLDNSDGRGILFLAPTRVLVNQHYDFLKEHLLLDDIGVVTGEDTITKRKKSWNNSIVCATPEIAKNDLNRKIVNAEQFALVIFDEAHRTVGDYAYCGIAQRFTPLDARLMGMTATLPSEKTKATEILTTLRISSIAQRTEESADVKPYVQETNTRWIRVKLSDDLRAIQTLLKLALDQRYETLRKNGLDLTKQKSLSSLLRIRQFVLMQNRRCAKPLFTAIRIHYALNMLEVHGVTSFLNFCDRTKAKKGIGIRELFEADSNFSRAVQLAHFAQQRGVEHTKIPKLCDLLKNVDGKALVFSSYRDSVSVIHKHLTEQGISAGILIGKAGDTGLKQKKQVETVQKFRDGQYQVLIATRVGEEGLDISEVNLVIFYDNVPSSIRFVQRRGRTGRRDTGQLVVFIAEDTIDEVYYWIGRRKMTSAKDMGKKMSETLEDNQSFGRGSGGGDNSNNAHSGTTGNNTLDTFT